MSPAPQGMTSEVYDRGRDTALKRCRDLRSSIGIRASVGVTFELK